MFAQWLIQFLESRGRKKVLQKLFLLRVYTKSCLMDRKVATE
jgi:hypothetical protein